MKGNRLQKKILITSYGQACCFPPECRDIFYESETAPEKAKYHGVKNFTLVTRRPVQINKLNPNQVRLHPQIQIARNNKKSEKLKSAVAMCERPLFETPNGCSTL